MSFSRGRNKAEFWTSWRPVPGKARDFAVQVEREGWDGLCITDSQNLGGDPYVAMALGSDVTTRLRFATGVTNAFTRHPAATAASIVSVDVESGGRAELGIGRGDSALSYLGLGPVSVESLAAYVSRVQAYLSGDSAGAETGGRDLRSVTPVADLASENRLFWLAALGPRPKVPVFVVASGQRMVKTAAKLADRVALAVGADPERVRWGIELARSVCPDIAVAAYVHVIPDADVDEATRLAAGGIATYARFSALHGRVASPVSEEDRQVLEALSRSYQVSKHYTSEGSQIGVITPEFAKRFAILGPPEYCVQRLRELVELGIDRFYVSNAAHDVSPQKVADIRLRFIDEVLPAFREP